MTLNDVMAVILRYFIEFGKTHAFQHITVSICGGIYAKYIQTDASSHIRCYQVIFCR